MVSAYITVDAPSRELSVRVAEVVKQCQSETARAWLGFVPLPRPCFVSVKIAEKPWGWTSYGKFGTTVIDAAGTEEELFSVTLPHEVAHSVIDAHIDFDVPQWLHEGVAISQEKNRPSRFKGKCGNMPFGRFFSLEEYPPDWEPYYGQCHSVTAHLVSEYGRDATFAFARQGITHRGYPAACLNVFGITLKELERDWKRTASNRRGRYQGGYEMDAGRRQIAC